MTCAPLIIAWCISIMWFAAVTSNRFNSHLLDNHFPSHEFCMSSLALYQTLERKAPKNPPHVPTMMLLIAFLILQFPLYCSVSNSFMYIWLLDILLLYLPRAFVVFVVLAVCNQQASDLVNRRLRNVKFIKTI